MRALFWGLGLLFGIVIYSVLSVKYPTFDSYVFMVGIPLVFAGIGGIIGERIKKSMEINEAEAKKEERRQKNKKKKSKKTREKGEFDIHQLPEKQLNQIKQLIAKDEKYQAAKELSEITGMNLNEAIDEIGKLE